MYFQLQINFVSTLGVFSWQATLVRKPFLWFLGFTVSPWQVLFGPFKEYSAVLHSGFKNKRIVQTNYREQILVNEIL